MLLISTFSLGVMRRRHARHADVVRLRAREHHALVNITTDITVGRLGRRRPHARRGGLWWRTKCPPPPELPPTPAGARQTEETKPSPRLSSRPRPQGRDSKAAT